MPNPYFSETEIAGLKPELVDKLTAARAEAGVPFIITSGLRSCAGNTAAMGVENSAHLKGLAVDLRCDNSWDRFKIVSALLKVGFVRLGLYNAHTHADLDPDKPQNVIWEGISH